MDKSIPNKIVEYISPRKGKIVFSSDFLDIGDVVAIRQALSRLTKEGQLVRLANGIYLSPKRDSQLGILYPAIEEIAEAIAKRDKARIRPTGIFALNKIGLSTQVPMKVTYLTDGSPRKIKVGNRTLTFKATSPKKLALKGELSSLVIQALQEIGQKDITENTIGHIQVVLKPEDAKVILDDARLAPAWIRKILISIVDKRSNDRLVNT